MNLVESVSEISEKIKECIKNEICENGLLSDVETFIPSYRMDEPMDIPAVWLFEHPTTEIVQKQGKLSSKIYLQTPFEFVCLVYEDDLEEAERLGKDLASRVGSSIMKHGLKLKNGERIIHNIVFKSLYPVGEVQIEGKTKKTPATSIVFEIRYYVDWLKCKKRMEMK